MVDCSLYITTYNWPQALELVLKSILKQTVLPNEVLIADDGSGDQTKRLIDSYKSTFPVPLVHCWQKDTGYRINAVRNLAIKTASFPYIIQIDGDVILHKDFVKDHLYFAKKRRYIVGRRVGINKHVTETFIKNKSYSGLTSLRSKIICILHNYLLYNTKSVKGLRGCNISFWKEDAHTVNGFDEDMTSKGPNDKEFGKRLVNSGVCSFHMKFYGVQYHLYHNEGNLRSNYSHVKGVFQNTINNKKIQCSNGLTKLGGNIKI